MKTLILAGGGHAHVEVLRRFGLSRPPGVRVLLVSPDSHTPYSGMLPGLLAGHYTRDDCHIDLRPLCDLAGAAFAVTRVEGIDLASRRVRCADGQTHGFDALSLDVGSTPDLRSVPGAAEHTVPVKPVSGLLEAWRDMEARCERRPAGPLRLAVVGGGAGGAEVALAMRRRCRREDPRQEPAIAIVTNGLLSGHSARARVLVARALARRRITLMDERLVVRLTAGEIQCASGERVPADLIVWATGAAAVPWVRLCGLACDDRGFAAVNDGLQSPSHPFVFAAGDVATMLTRPLPKAGVFAVRQGPLLDENLRRYLAGEPLRPFRPQPRYLSLMSTGDGHGIASWAGLAWEGRWVWAWKDRIDRSFMRKYRAGRIPP